MNRKNYRTIVNGVEISPEITEVLRRWYDYPCIEDMEPYLYIQWLSDIQDYRTRIWVNRNDDAEDISTLKDCVNGLIQIKDDLKRFIPQKKNESNEAD
jgi:hypothetical protein